MKIRTKFIAVNTLLVAAAVSIITIACLAKFQSELCRQAAQSQEARLQTFRYLLQAKGNLRLSDGKLMAGDYVLNGNYELPDKLKELSGGTATIFMADERISTNVHKPDGSRAVGTKLQGPVMDVVLGQGKPYRGEAEILGVPYFTAYDPIKNDKGEPIGILYVGVRKSEFLAAYESLRLAVIGIMVLLIAVTGLVNTFAIRRLFKPLNTMHDLLRDIAEGEGDLTRRLTYLEQDEVGDISRSFNTFVEKLHTIISRVSSAGSGLATVCERVHETALGIATKAEEASSQTGSVAAAGEEMAATTAEIAHNCVSLADEATKAKNSARTGSAVVTQTIDLMNRVEERVTQASSSVESLGKRSDEIGAIVATIEDIADQTNLLALNAAIEAARAGEQGRGFAVVADEVRALAQRTAEATQEVSRVIRTIQTETRQAVDSMQEGMREVSNGTGAATQSGEALAVILTSIESVAEEVRQIATASEQQSATTSEISGNIHRVADLIGSASQGARTSAATAEELAHQAEELQKIVAMFRLA